jgi:hypothetical protein
MLPSLRNIGVNKWRTRALDKMEWASVMREELAKHKGLCAKEEERFAFSS